MKNNSNDFQEKIIEIRIIVARSNIWPAINALIIANKKQGNSQLRLLPW